MILGLLIFVGHRILSRSWLSRNRPRIAVGYYVFEILQTSRIFAASQR